MEVVSATEVALVLEGGTAGTPDAGGTAALETGGKGALCGSGGCEEKYDLGICALRDIVEGHERLNLGRNRAKLAAFNISQKRSRTQI